MISAFPVHSVDYRSANLDSPESINLQFSRVLDQFHSGLQLYDFWTELLFAAPPRSHMQSISYFFIQAGETLSHLRAELEAIDHCLETEDYMTAWNHLLNFDQLRKTKFTAYVPRTVYDLFSRKNEHLERI